MTFLSARMLVILREGVFAVVFAASAVGAADSQTEQWCCWFYPWRTIFGSAAIAAIPAISEMTNIRQECPGIKSELRPRWPRPSRSPRRTRGDALTGSFGVT